MPDASHPPMVGQDCSALFLLAAYKDAWTRYTGRLHHSQKMHRLSFSLGAAFPPRDSDAPCILSSEERRAFRPRFGSAFLKGRHPDVAQPSLPAAT